MQTAVKLERRRRRTFSPSSPSGSPPVTTNNMMINDKAPWTASDRCLACRDPFNSDKKNKHNLLQWRPGGPSSREKKPDYAQALEAITGVPVSPGDGRQNKAVCTRCRSMLSKYHKNVYEVGRITAFIRERAGGLSDTSAAPMVRLFWLFKIKFKRKVLCIVYCIALRWCWSRNCSVLIDFD